MRTEGDLVRLNLDRDHLALLAAILRPRVTTTEAAVALAFEVIEAAKAFDPSREEPPA